METQHYVLGSSINFYFQDYMLSIEIDKFNPCDRNIDYEAKRHKAIQKELDSEFIRINPDENKFKNKNKKYKIENKNYKIHKLIKTYLKSF